MTLKEIIIVVGGFMLLVFGLSGGLALFDRWYADYKCHQYGEITEREVRFSYVSGCFVKMDDGRFVHYREIRQVNEN
jgi:hypothetical protein